MATTLTDKGVKALKTVGYHADHGKGSAVGLYVQVKKSAKGEITRSWIFRFVSPIEKRSRWMGLGDCRTVSLAKAREKAVAARDQVLDGNDPINERDKLQDAKRAAHIREIASTMTFKQCADAYLAEHRQSWSNAKHRQQWTTSLDRANAAFGDLPVKQVDVDVIVKFLQPIWNATPETGSRIRMRIEKVLHWATASKFRDEILDGKNPARWSGNLEHLLAAKPKPEHHAALPFAELPAFMGELRERESISARALEFAILTASRTNEVIGAKWSEIEGDVWTIPGERMKNRKPHRVPLSDRALAILARLPRTGDYVFPGARAGKPLSDMAMLELLKGMNGGGLTVHGFRSTFSDWARERTNYARDVVEMALAHTIKDKSEAAYRRGDALPKRSRLMAEWARYCESTPVQSAEIVPIRA